MRKRLSIVVLIAVAIVAAAVYLWFREVPLRVQISDIALDPQAYDGKLVEVEGRLMYEIGFGGGYALTDEKTKIALLVGNEKRPFDQYLDKYVVITGRVEYLGRGFDVPELLIKISKLSKSSQSRFSLYW